MPAQGDGPRATSAVPGVQDASAPAGERHHEDPGVGVVSIHLCLVNKTVVLLLYEAITMTISPDLYAYITELNHMTRNKQGKLAEWRRRDKKKQENKGEANLRRKGLEGMIDSERRSRSRVIGEASCYY